LNNFFQSDDGTTEGSVQSPTISSVSENSEHLGKSQKMSDELEAALVKIQELENIIRLKDERIKLLEEEHERHLLHGHILASPDVERKRRGRKKIKRTSPKEQMVGYLNF